MPVGGKIPRLKQTRRPRAHGEAGDGDQKRHDVEARFGRRQRAHRLAPCFAPIRIKKRDGQTALIAAAALA
jgi:hypothetical protein